MSMKVKRGLSLSYPCSSNVFGVKRLMNTRKDTMFSTKNSGMHLKIYNLKKL